jgi:hypothetical protein
MYTANSSETQIPQVENSWSFKNRENVEGELILQRNF